MTAQAPIGVILAGGRARRLGGTDKGAVLLAGKRLFDHVFERLAPQVERVLIAGPHNYDFALPFMEDQPSGPDGPAAGLFAALEWMGVNAPKARGFVTAPVDAPFLPRDLTNRLCAGTGSAIARCAGRLHPTFAYWDTEDLRAFFQAGAAAPALHKIAAALGAREVDFGDERAFFNVNTPEDVKAAAARL